jgi:hypothetical protein
MQRMISISMAAVLAGWLAVPVISACDMKCCHRAVTVSHCLQMEDKAAHDNAESEPEIYEGSSACPGKCCVKGRNIRFGLAVPGFDYCFSVPQVSAQSVSSLGLWLQASCLRASRAPPLTV